MFAKLRILPLVMVLAAVGFVFKVGHVADGVNEWVKTANAKPQQAEQTTPGSEEGNAKNLLQEGEADTPPPLGDDPMSMSKSELDLLQSLSDRRAQLESWEGQLTMRERLLNATEKRIDDKIARLESIENQVRSLVEVHEERENKELDSLVSLYSRMKPKDAARIFEQLDLPIQMEVATRMKESKMAPIMAAMSSDSATKLTVEMATRAKMPPIDG